MTRNRSLRRLYRSARFEPLEDRQLLSINPTLATIEDVTLKAGAPLYLALDGFDADGDSLSYSVTSSNSSIGGSVLEGNRSIRVVVEGYGDMIFELFEQRAPKTTGQIIDFIEDDYYNGLIFHRIAEYSDGSPFVIQGGDPDGDGSGGPGFSFDDEFHTELLHTSAGILSMANSGEDTNGSQFFITGADTRHLDFNHSVFGILTEGDSVRQSIQDADVDSSSKPVTDIVMTDVSVFFDEENGTLMLSAPEDFTGEADITVTVDDGNGGTAQRTFHVTVVADDSNSSPYLQDVAIPELAPGETVTFQLPGYDAEGDDIEYDGIIHPSSDDLTITISDTGLVTLTAADTASGVYGIYVGLHGTDSSNWDTQRLPVYVSPAAPSSIKLLTSSDMGSSSTDGITNFDNELWFRVSGVVPGAEVSLYSDGVLVGQTMAGTDGSVVIVTNTTSFLGEGSHQITAKQVLRDQSVEIGNYDETVDIFGEMSSEIDIMIDMTSPIISSLPPYVAGSGLLYEYQVELETPESGVRYQLLNSPAGMTINIDTGLISWTPNVSAGVTQYIEVKATDTAGNEVTQSYTLYIKPPPLFGSVDDQVVAEEELLEFTVEATSQNGEPTVVYSLGVNAPAGISIDSDSGVVTWTPTEAQGPDHYPVVVYATDSEGVNNHMTIWVDVTEVNLPPALPVIEDITVDEGATIQFNVTATDLDLPANQLTYSFIGDVPNGAAINTTTGELTWIPNEYQGGYTFDLTVRVSDAAGATDETSFTVTVVEVDDAPVFGPQNINQFAFPGSMFSTKFHAADPDYPTRSVEYSFGGEVPEGMTIDPITGQVTWNVPEDTIFFQFPLVVRASEVLLDGSLGLSSTQTIQVMIDYSWLAVLEQKLLAKTENNLIGEDLDESVLAALALAATNQPAISATGNTSQRSSLTGLSTDFTSEEGFFGIQFGTSTASGSMVISPFDADAEEERSEVDSRVRDDKVTPANAIEKTPRTTSRSDQDSKTAKATTNESLVIESSSTDDPTTVAELPESYYYDMAAENPTLQTTAQLPPKEETPES